MQEYVNNSNIFTIDALYLQPQLAAIHLVREQNRIALIDTGTQYSVPQVETALEKMGLNFSHVELIVLTHIHLDHAGGASSLMQLCENAELVVHPKGARHMAEPEKLVAGATAVYGETEFKKLYGNIMPIDAARIVSPADGEEISLGNRAFRFLDSPGHANHHHCILDIDSNSVFTGDTLGIAYQALRDPDHAFVMPTTTPVQFNPEALHHSIDRVMSLQPEYLYYTHYSALKPSLQNIAGLHEQIDDYVLLTQQAAEQIGEITADNSDQFEKTISALLFDYLLRRAKNELSSIDEDTIKNWIKLDAQLNSQGLAFWWQYKRN